MHHVLQTAGLWVGHVEIAAGLPCSGMSKTAPSDRRPHVRMLLHGAFRQFAGDVRDVALDAETLGEALEALVRAHPTLTERLRDERGTLRPHLALFINQDDARLLGWEDAPLREGDVVHVIPALSGG
jgi:molybdopterin converting factor small subunit